MEGIALFFFAFVVLFGIATFFGGWFTVATAEMAVVQRLGKFVRVAGPGLNFKLPWLEKVAGRVNLRVQQFRVDCILGSRQRLSFALYFARAPTKPGWGVAGLWFALLRLAKAPDKGPSAPRGVKCRSTARIDGAVRDVYRGPSS
jgi:hypothetical protein